MLARCKANTFEPQQARAGLCDAGSVDCALMHEPAHSGPSPRMSGGLDERYRNPDQKGNRGGWEWDGS